MFTIRVYGIAIHKGGVLLSRERIQGRIITKFPGGGLEYGEGPSDCVKREFHEELGQPARVLSHFYTTDFFVPSAFHKRKQVISIYYRVSLEEPDKVPTGEELTHDKEQVFLWVPLQHLHTGLFDLPIDRKVAQLLGRQASGD